MMVLESLEVLLFVYNLAADGCFVIFSVIDY